MYHFRLKPALAFHLTARQHLKTIIIVLHADGDNRKITINQCPSRNKPLKFLTLISKSHVCAFQSIWLFCCKYRTSSAKANACIKYFICFSLLSRTETLFLLDFSISLFLSNKMKMYNITIQLKIYILLAIDLYLTIGL